MGEVREVAEEGGIRTDHISVVQAVLLFGSETWVLPAAKLEKLEGSHISFLPQVTGMKA